MPSTIQDLDNVLPQTQCGLCGYKGCKPYAEAIITQNETIDRCPPGGVETLFALAKLTHTDPTPYIANIQEKTIPPQLAVIREYECIGCTKCIQACPVDAIIGAAKLMHTVVSDECTGCGLCLPPCPVDCIDLVNLSFSATQEKRDKARMRFEARHLRLNREKEKKKIKEIKKIESAQKKTLNISADEIKAVVTRVIEKKQKNK